MKFRTFCKLRVVRRTAGYILATSIAALIVSAADQTWDGGSLVDGQWTTLPDWLGDSAAPGNASSTANQDIAWFNAPIANTWGNSTANPIGIDVNRTIGGINFDLASDSYFIGSTGGTALKVSSGGSIQILNTLTATNVTATINAPLQIQGSYTMVNNSANGSGAGAGTLKVGGGITSGVSGSRTLTLSGSNTNDNTVSGIIANGTATTLGLNKAGIGNWVLTAANTYTGRTTINGGTLTLAFGTVSTNILPSGSALTLGGGTLALTGTGTQTVNGLTTTTNTGSRIVVGANETLTLGALTSAGIGSALNFNTAAGGANASTSTVGTSLIGLTGLTTNSGFTVTDAGGFGLATVNGSNQVVRSTATTLLPATLATSTTDYRIDNNAGTAATAGSSTLIITLSESAKSITVDTTAAAGVLTLGPAAVLRNNTWNFGGVGSNTSQVTGGAGLLAVASGNEIHFNNLNTGAVTISSPILANGANLVRVFGTGTLVFTATNTYNGGTTVSSGTLELATGGAISGGAVVVGNASGDNGTLKVTGGTVSSTSGSLGNNANSSGTVTVSSGSWTNSSQLDVGVFGAGVLNITGGTVAVANANTFLGLSAGSSGMATVSGGSWTNTGSLSVGNSGTGLLNVTGSGLVTVGSTGTSTLFIAQSSGGQGTLNLGTGGVAGTLNAGVVTGGSGTSAVVNFNQSGAYTFAPQLTGTLSVNVLGGGTTTLTNANTYTGGTNVNRGTLLLSGASNMPTTGTLQVNAGGTFSLADGTARTTTTTARLSLASGANLTFDWNAGSLDKITSTAAATTTGTVGISIRNTSPTGSGGTLISSASGGLTTANGTKYFLANNTNFTTAALTVSDTAVSIGAQTAATALTNAYWRGGQVTGALGTMSYSLGTTSNWASDAAGTASGGVVPGSTANLFFSTTSGATQQSAVTLGSDMTVNSVTFNDSTAVTLGGNNLLTIQATNANGNIAGNGLTVSSTSAATTIINANVGLGAAQSWTVASGKILAVSGVISGTGDLTKAGAGTLTLSGANTYSGSTTVNAGTLLVSGSISGSVTTVNNAGSTLGGTGIVGPVNVQSGAILQGGDGTAATGALTSAGNVFLADGSIMELTLGAGLAHSSFIRTAGRTWVFDSDQLFTFTILNGATAGFYDNVISGLSGLDLNASGLATVGTWLIDPSTGVTGTFAYDGAGGVDLTVSVIPEPGTAALLVGCMPLLGAQRWRRRKSPQRCEGRSSYRT